MQTKDLFEAALGLSPPWKVASFDFGPEAGGDRGRLEIRLEFERGGRLPCPECGAHDSRERTRRHFDLFQRTSYLVARVPRVCCEYRVRRVVTVTEFPKFATPGRPLPTVRIGREHGGTLYGPPVHADAVRHSGIGPNAGRGA